MDVQHYLALAAELRARAEQAHAHERADLLFLASEYERMAETPPLLLDGAAVRVRLPR